jgi:regulator of nonsense transcripts 2
MEAIENDFESQLEALSQIEQLKKERDEIMSVRAANLPVAIQSSRKEHEANKNQLKSDLKKTTAFVKKIRSINSEGLQQCIRDVETLNLSLYISEIVDAILETAYKATDVPGMVKLSAALHRRYAEFTVPLVSGLRAAMIAVPSDEDKDAGKRKRIQIRFSIELYQAGVIVDEDLFVALLRSLTGKSKE